MVKTTDNGHRAITRIIQAIVKERSSGKKGRNLKEWYRTVATILGEEGLCENQTYTVVEGKHGDATSPPDNAA